MKSWISVLCIVIVCVLIIQIFTSPDILMKLISTFGTATGEETAKLSIPIFGVFKLEMETYKLHESSKIEDIEQ
ncbi:MAG: hypothetical protein K0R54_596 [Clostridiaceae bacterium]|nr:hypothetical protein [Clostridiaceae bacterium]